MLFRSLIVLTSLITSILADVQYAISNTNFTISQGSQFLDEGERYLYNYNRLRLRLDYTKGNYFVTFIGDGVNYYGGDYINSTAFEYLKLSEADTPFKTQSNFHIYDNGTAYAKLYRFYVGYEEEQNRILLGLQNIAMGVGRIWTPTDLFNPKNSYALEPDEVLGVVALTYTRHLNDTSQLTLVASQKEDNSYKYALRYSAFIALADVAINMIHSDETKMLGYEIEGNFADSGIELRSEGAYIQNEKEFFQGIIGADYGFENGLIVAVEGLYSSKTFTYEEILLNFDSEILQNMLYSHFYLGATLSKSFNLVLDGSITYIESFNDKNSRFITPALSYTLNDYNTFQLGAMIYSGGRDSEFEISENSYYFRYSLSF